jgi:uncharacterized protein YbjT (DUF2867 family)
MRIALLKPMKYKYLVLGGTGHIGSALADALLQSGESVLVVGHDPSKRKEWENKGAGFEATDVTDSHSLCLLFNKAERLFILNPPAPPSTDIVAQETKTIDSILAAIRQVRLEKIVAASTYGAQPGEDIADLGTLYHLEQGLHAQHMPFAIIRSAYYMSNWDAVLEMAKKDGILPTMFPAGFTLPMVAPADIGKYAAALLQNGETGLRYIEGPQHYSPNDVAEAISQAIDKPVKVATIPPDQWIPSLKKLGFSDPAAESMANMTKLTIESKFETLDAVHGDTSLEEYLLAKLHPAAQAV